MNVGRGRITGGDVAAPSHTRGEERRGATRECESQ